MTEEERQTEKRGCLMGCRFNDSFFSSLRYADRWFYVQCSGLFCLHVRKETKQIQGKKKATGVRNQTNSKKTKTTGVTFCADHQREENKGNSHSCIQSHTKILRKSMTEKARESCTVQNLD